MSYRVDNAIIMAAGISSRFAPLSFEKPKALISIKGEVLIERQIRQLREAGIRDVILVVGYLKEQFAYLQDKFGVTLVENPEYETRNNNSSIFAARSYFKNSFVCSADNYFSQSPFEREVDESYYAAVYSEGPTDEWCIKTDEDGWIKGVQVGGENSWYMLGHTFWSQSFSCKFLDILLQEYDKPETKDMLWEALFALHLDRLPMKIRKYSPDAIFEFDSLDELRMFDWAYQTHSGSKILAEISKKLNCSEGDLTAIKPLKDTHSGVMGITFTGPAGSYQYTYSDSLLKLKEVSLCK